MGRLAGVEDLKVYHVRHRVYDPASFRWLQKDPAGYVDGMNLYAYCAGDPINWADPYGLDKWSWYEGWGTTIGYLFGGSSEHGAAGKVWGAGVRGAGDGVVMTADVFTFGQIDGLHQAAQTLLREGDWTYVGGYIASNVSREAIIIAVTIATGQVAGGGTDEVGRIASLLNLISESRGAVRGAQVIVTTLSVWDVGSGAYSAGNGFYRVAAEHDPWGWMDIGLGGLRAAGGFQGARSVGAVVTTLEEDLTASAQRAATRVGPGKGPAHGTRVHTAFEDEVGALDRDNLRTEVSFKNGAEVRRGTRGSVRMDVIEVDASGNVLAVYDLKTGSAVLTSARIARIRSHLPPCSANVPIKEIRP